jgi:hypothetical protein
MDARRLLHAAALTALVVALAATVLAQSPRPILGNSVVSGVVRDAGGRPVVDARVSVARRFKLWNGGYYTAMSRLTTDATDDRGTFRLHSLPAGSYVVVVVPGAHPLNAPPPENTAYMRSYFPGTPSLRDAATITVRDQTESSIAISLPAVPVTSITGHVRRSDGSAAERVEVSLRGSATALGALARGEAAMSRFGTYVDGVADGRFEIKNVPAGNYDLEVIDSMHRGDAMGEVASVPIRVGDTPIRDVSVTMTRPAIVRGRIVWDGMTAPPTKVTRGIRAVPIGRGYLYDSDIQVDGTFELKGFLGLTRFESGMSLPIK